MIPGTGWLIAAIAAAVILPAPVKMLAVILLTIIATIRLWRWATAKDQDRGTR